MALNRWESVSVREPKKCLTMEHWRLAYLGMRRMPRNLSEFELATFFTFSSKERALINARRGPLYRLALPLHIDFVWMTGAMLDAYQYVPPILWRHLGKHLGIEPPDLGTLRTLYETRLFAAPGFFSAESNSYI
jgi:hypothetical protein